MKKAMPSTGRVEVRLESSLESVDQAEGMARRFAQAAGFSEEDLDKIGMSVREGLVNAVHHGNKYDTHKRAGLRLEMEGPNLVVTVTDQGSGFDLAGVPNPLASENLLKQTGRGIFLMRAFMDEVEVRRLSPTGTEVRMTKHAAPANGKED
jgi:serine/threonine-protein kinase RsbW